MSSNHLADATKLAPPTENPMAHKMTFVDVDPIGDVCFLLKDMEVRISSKVLSLASKVRLLTAHVCPLLIFSQGLQCDVSVELPRRYLARQE